MANTTLQKARKAKNDEFYTRISDIEKECFKYKDYFKGQTILCNCDDPYKSEFFKYFALNFNFFGLKKLIASSYTGSPISNIKRPFFNYNEAENKTAKSPHKIEITEVIDEKLDGVIDISAIKHLLKNKKNALVKLKGNGDFRSDECIEILKEADIVITNPPFSLFREYVAQLMEYKKKFLIIGSLNAITYKETFKLIKENKMWLGYNNGPKKFIVPKDYDHIKTFIKDGKHFASMGNTGWFTNLDIKKRHKKINLHKKYTAEEYPHYDNYNAIDVDKYFNIPIDYDGLMGVPISFLDKHNPNQFEIIGIDRYVEDNPNYGHRFKVNGKEKYARILIKNLTRMHSL
jgi:hypothetical protein